MTPTKLYHALVLAGSRNEDDPIVKYRGTANKAMTPILDVPMLIRVLDTLLNCHEIHRITVCFDQPELIQSHDLIQKALKQQKLNFIDTAATPASSVQAFLNAYQNEYPFLLTTADHPLLTSNMVTNFIENSDPYADLSVGLATEKVIQSAYPQSVRTYYRMRDGGFSGCNLYIIRSRVAEKVIVFWQKMERYRKKPLRLIAQIGWWSVIRFRLFGLTINQAFQLLSKRLGVNAQPTIIPYAEAAIDVDKPSDFDLASQILQNRLAQDPQNSSRPN